MGIYDREYIRAGPRSRSGLGSLRFVSFNTWLIITNVAVFLLNNGLLASFRVWPEGGQRVVEGVTSDQVRQAVVDRSRLLSDQATGQLFYGMYLRTEQGDVPIGQQLLLPPMQPLSAYGHFSTGRAFFGLEVWRFVTFQFLHADFWHLLFNMLGLLVFGGMVEQYLGFKRYAAFYLLCGIFGAIGYLILNFLGAVVGLSLPGVLIHDIYTPLVGASAGVFGVIMAAAFIAPRAVVIIPILPIPMPMWVMAYGYVILALVNLLTGGRNAGGDAAHLGGAVAGYFFIRNTHLLRDFFDIMGRRGGGARTGPAYAPAGPDPAEIERILGKVTEFGLASLDGDEKDALRRHSEWLRRQR